DLRRGARGPHRRKVIDPRAARMLETARPEMAQAPEHSGNLSHVARAERAELERVVAPAAQKTRAYYQTLSFSAAGIELGLSVGLGALAGYWIDGKAGTAPLFMLALTVIGFAAGVRAMLRAARRATRAAADGSGASKP